MSLFFWGLGVEAERVPRLETERAMLGPLLGQGSKAEAERQGVNTERVVHFMWQAQHCGSVTCKEMARYDTSMYT